MPSPNLDKLLWYFLRLPRQHSVKCRQCTTGFTRNFCLACLLKCSKGNLRCLYSMILENKSLFVLARFQMRRKKKYFWIKFLLLSSYTSYLLDESCALTSILHPEPFWSLRSEVTGKGRITCCLFFFFFKYLWHKGCFNPHWFSCYREESWN